MPTLVLDHTPITFTVIRAARRKRTISLMMEPTGHLIIRAPLRAKTNTIEHLIQKHSDWILKKIAVNLQQLLVAKRQFITGEQYFYLGDKYSLQIFLAIGEVSSCQLKDDYLHVRLAPNNDGIIILKNWYRQQANALFFERITAWEQRLGVKANQLKLSQARTRWGSCNAQNTICLNWRLMMAPLSLIDYVVVHELCHIVHKNHSKNFWHLVGSVMPDYARRRKILHQEGRKWLEDF
jgi:predicted metal-dependent hydrolase